MAEKVDDSEKRTDNRPGVRAITTEAFDNEYPKIKRNSLTSKHPSIHPVIKFPKKV